MSCSPFEQIANLQTDTDGSVSLDSCTTLKQVVDTIDASSTKSGYAAVGSNDSSNFKTLVGSSGLSGNDRAFVRMISANLYEVIASSLTTATGVKVKYIRRAGWGPTDENRMSQTQWVTYTLQS